MRFGIDGFCFIFLLEGWIKGILIFLFGGNEIKDIMNFCLIGLGIIYCFKIYVERRFIDIMNVLNIMNNILNKKLEK